MGTDGVLNKGGRAMSADGVLNEGGRAMGADGVLNERARMAADEKVGALNQRAKH